VVGDYLSDFLSSADIDVVHVTSCLTLSASVLTATASLGVPLVLTLTDFWFVCPRIKLIKGNGERCDGHVTAWECLRCMLWGAKAYRWPTRVMPERVVAKMLRWIARQPSITRHRGLRGMAFDIDDRRDFLKRALQRCDGILVKSAYMRDYFVGHGLSDDRLLVLPDGEDTSWGALRGREDKPEILRIGYIGHIIPSKGVHTLIQAVKRLQGDTELLIHGDLDHDPDYANSLRSIVGENETVCFRGGFAHERIGEVLSQIDVLVVPSTWPETFCHVVREGFIAGIPVIGSDIGAIPEAIQHGKNGFLFHPGDAGDLSRYLQMILDDPGLLTRLQRNIPAVKTVDQQARELIGLYQALLERNKLSKISN